MVYKAGNTQELEKPMQSGTSPRVDSIIIDDCWKAGAILLRQKQKSLLCFIGNDDLAALSSDKTLPGNGAIPWT